VVVKEEHKKKREVERVALVEVVENLRCVRTDDVERRPNVERRDLLCAVLYVDANMRERVRSVLFVGRLRTPDGDDK